jgi:hypothetical protein
MISIHIIWILLNLLLVLYCSFETQLYRRRSQYRQKVFAQKFRRYWAPLLYWGAITGFFLPKNFGDIGKFGDIGANLEILILPGM